jgi:hypothetical protein
MFARDEIYAAGKGGATIECEITAVLDTDANRVGQSICDTLEEKQSKHLTRQLPTLFDKFNDKRHQLEVQIRNVKPPSWQLVEDVLHTCCRLVHCYADGGDPPFEGPLVHGGVCQGQPLRKVWNEERPSQEWKRAFVEGSRIHYERDFSQIRDDLLNSFTKAVSTAAIYNTKGSAESVIIDECIPMFTIAPSPRLKSGQGWPILPPGPP